MIECSGIQTMTNQYDKLPEKYLGKTHARWTDADILDTFTYLIVHFTINNIYIINSIHTSIYIS